MTIGPFNKGGGCCCVGLQNLAVVPMGGDGLDNRVFNTLERLADHGGSAWWLYLSRCEVCLQNWMVAQEERIFDDYFLRRLSSTEVDEIVAEGRWPTEFATYERVLTVGHLLSRACVFFDPLHASLVWTARDLRSERPDITVSEIASLIGVGSAEVDQLLSADVS